MSDATLSPAADAAAGAATTPARYLVTITTNGNQRFIFSSPRLRDNIGASHAIRQLTSWTEKALTKADVAPSSWTWVSRSSGKVILMMDRADDARSVISAVTRRGLREAPGIDVTGVFVPMASARLTQDDLKALDATDLAYALSRPPADSRFRRQPFLLQARDSALPASPPLTSLGVTDEAKDDFITPLSLPSRVNRYWAYRAQKWILDLLKDDEELKARADAKDFARHLKELEELLLGENTSAAEDNSPLSKVAVIHIDGNGVGAIMRNLDKAMGRVDADLLAKVLKGDTVDEPPQAPTSTEIPLEAFILAVSKHLDDAVTGAYLHAWRTVAELAPYTSRKGTRPIPVLPVILGGDDVTVITDGDYALPFTAAYLEEFERLTEADKFLRALGDGRHMTAGAGISIVPRMFPFHIAYDIAENLATRAKKLGKESEPVVSTLSYHVLFDSTVLDPDEILDVYKGYTTRPFIIDTSSTTSASGVDHSWESVLRRTAVFQGLVPAPSSGKIPDPFPKARAHRIRTLLAKKDHASTEEQREKLQRDIDQEWEACRKAVGDKVDIEQDLGGMKALFDLLELSDLLPKAYLNQRLIGMP